MELAVHMINVQTGEKRIKKVIGKDASLGNWECKDFFHGSKWSWKGTEPWKNVAGKVKSLGNGYYKKG